LENKSSFPPNPPGLPVPRPEAGAALVHPPKSSSDTTVGVDLVFITGGAPQPLPMSFAVNVSGTFMVAGWALEAEMGSGVLQASLPHASKLAENMLLTLVAVVAIGCGTGWAG